MPSEKETDTVARVLAAGQGQRYGGDKRIATLPDGQRVLDRTVKQALQVFAHVYVVQSKHEVALAPCERLTSLISDRAHHGMGASLADGAAFVLDHSRASAMAILLGDMPWTRAETYLTLIAAASADTIVVPWLNGQQGHPVVFGHAFWKDLLALDGDRGGRTVLQTHARYVRRLSTDDPGVLLDIDHPEDLTRGPTP
jgi:molybdenum cofactor cytidylyltransferase